MSLLQTLGLFITGFRDSTSLQWIPKILLFAHPQTKQIHPQTYKMIKILKNSLIQVLVFLIGLPTLCLWLGLTPLYYGLNAIFLVLTYGWLFFYNDDIIVATKKVALWSAEARESYFGKMYSKQKVQFFTALSGQAKSFIFLVLYYLPIFILATFLSTRVPVVGPCFLLLSESFFNSTFYFLKLWPYDKYNVGFIEKYWAYMVGYGFFVSLVCNILLGGSLARGAYFLISQWMIINCILYGPPETEFKSISDILSSQPPSRRGNAYNTHRFKIRNDETYRNELVKNTFILKPAMVITQLLNQKLSKVFPQSSNNVQQDQSST